MRPNSLIWPLPLRLPHQNFTHICYCYHACYKSNPAHHQDDQQITQVQLTELIIHLHVKIH
jgi:hypothetical protein